MHLCLWSLALASSIPVLGLQRVCPRKCCPCPWRWPQIFLCPWPRALCSRIHLWLLGNTYCIEWFRCAPISLILSAQQIRAGKKSRMFGNLAISVIFKQSDLRLYLAGIYRIYPCWLALFRLVIQRLNLDGWESKSQWGDAKRRTGTRPPYKLSTDQ